MGIFSFGKKDDAAPRRRGAAEAGSGWRSNQDTRVERRSRRTDRAGDAEAMLLDPTLPEKQRARRRLVGAIALVVAAIVVLPMVLDSHPKPVTSDIAIDIPNRPAVASHKGDAADAATGVAGVTTPAADAPTGASVAGATLAAQGASGALGTGTTAAAVAAPAKAATQTAQAVTPAAKSAPTSQPPRAQQAAQPPAQQTTAATVHGAANAAANTSPSPSTTADTGTPAAPPGARYAVQLGAFANETTARNWVTKLKAAGVPAYTELRKEPDGSTRTLLRAGPFADRQAATDAIAKVRGAGLMAGSNGAAE